MKRLVLLFALLGLTARVAAQHPFFPTLTESGESWTYLATDGQLALTLNGAEFQDLHPFSEGLAAAQEAQTGFWGYIDEKGKWKIKPQFETADDFTDGYAIVSKTCRAECYTGSAGILNTTIGYVIDQKGKVLLTDHSQHEQPELRYFLDKNLGNGLFRVTFGYGYADMKNFLDLKGRFLCDTYSVFSRGDIVYEPALDAYRCRNLYYTAKGAAVLDLSRYTFVNDFSDGYAWAVLEEVTVEDEYSYWNVLVDLAGNEVLRLSEDDYSLPAPVVNGAFSYTDANLEPMQYLIAEARSIPYVYPEQADVNGRPIEPPVDLDYTYTIMPVNASGIRYFYRNNDVYPGFVSTKGEVFFKRGE